MDSAEHKTSELDRLRGLNQQEQTVPGRRGPPHWAWLVLVMGGGLAWLLYGGGASDQPANSTSARHPAVGSSPAQLESEERTQVHWLEDYDEALARAKQLDRPVLIDFATTWCAPCVMMDKHVWPKPAVQEALDSKVVPLRIDLDAKSAPPLVEKYSIEYVPTILLIDAQGQELKREGFVDDEQLIEMIKGVMRAEPIDTS